jgi:tRNA(Ser,Leu) C12 N-acetylase TAN1
MIATYTDMWITSNPQQQRQKQTEARKRQETVRMATIEYNSTMTRERVMRKHNKDSMAGLLFKIWHEINEIRDNEKLSEERQKKLDEIQNRIAWG